MNFFNKSNFSLMQKIIIAFAGYSILMLVILSTLAVVLQRGHIRSVHMQYGQSIMTERAKLTEQYIENIIENLTLVARTEDLIQFEPETSMDYLQVLSQANPDRYGRYFYVDLEGHFYDTLGVNKMIELTDDMKDLIEGYETLNYGFQSNDSTFKQSTLQVMIAVERKGVVQGILGVTVLMKDYENHVIADNVFNLGYTYVTDANGQLLAHYDNRMVTNPEAFTSAMGSDYEEVLSKLLINTQENNTAFIRLKLSSGDVMYLNMIGIGDSPLKMVMALHGSDIFATLRLLMVQLMIAVFVLGVMSVILGMIFARDITMPITRLIEVTTKFATGVKGIRAKVESKDEIGALAGSFNAMADTIVAHTDNLEELIKERTQVLADLNYQIVSRNKELGTMNEELEKTNNKLHELASKDMLTGLYNRHEFQRDLQKTMDLVNAGKEENFALIFIDLDNFKYYNDTFSHEMGDYILQMVSEILKKNVRENDIVGRYGGDEFIILLRQGDYEQAKVIAERMHKAILDRDGFKVELGKKLGGEVKIMGKNKLSSSIGIVNYMKSMNMVQAEALLSKADETMYKAKKQGKSRIVVA